MPLYKVVGKNKFKWDEEQQKAFDDLKEAHTHPSVLALPDRASDQIFTPMLRTKP